MPHLVLLERYSIVSMQEKHWTIINYALIALAGVVGFYMSNGVFAFGGNNRLLSVPETIIASSILLLVFSALIVINIIRNKYHPNWVLIGILTLLFVMNTINILCYKDGTTFSFTGVDNTVYSFPYLLNPDARFTEIFAFLATMGCALLILDICYQVVDFKQFIKIVCFAAIGVCTVLIIISYFMQGYKYFILYKHLFDNELYHCSIQSVFATKNAYAAVLIIGFLASIILHSQYRKWWYLAIGGYMFINIVHTICKAVIILSLIIAVAYLIYIFITTYKEHKKMNLIALAAIGGTILAVILGLFIFLAATKHLNGFFRTIFYSKGVDTFQTRVYIWKKSIDIISEFNWFTGCGHILFGRILHEYNILDTATGEVVARYSAHSGYLQYIGEGGIIYLLIILALISFVIYLGIRNFKKDKPMMFISLMTVICFAIYMSIESASIFIASGMEFGVISMLAISPILFVSRQK